MLLDDKLIMGAVPVLAGFFKWLNDYSKEVGWPRAKFLEEKMSLFLADPDTRAVFTILDWNSSQIQIPDGDGDQKDFYFDDEIIISTLATNDKREKFSREEFYIRGLFDKFFDNLANFNIWAETGLISRQDARKYVRYYLDILSGKRHNKPHRFVVAVREYLDYYEFDNTKKFIHRRFF